MVRCSHFWRRNVSMHLDINYDFEGHKHKEMPSENKKMHPCITEKQRQSTIELKKTHHGKVEFFHCNILRSWFWPLYYTFVMIFNLHCFALCKADPQIFHGCVSLPTVVYVAHRWTPVRRKTVTLVIFKYKRSAIPRVIYLLQGFQSITLLLIIQFQNLYYIDCIQLLSSIRGI